MKEATGELNMTVVIVVAVASLSAFFFTILWPSIKNSFVASSKCADAICDVKNAHDGVVTCKYYKNGRQVGNDFTCTYKG